MVWLDWTTIHWQPQWMWWGLQLNQNKNETLLIYMKEKWMNHHGTAIK